jgi:hypothetical protein
VHVKRLLATVSIAAFAFPAAGWSAGGPDEDYTGPSFVPTLPSTYSKALAKASFTHDYDTVWGYLHPTLQKAIDEGRWKACQRKYPVAGRSLTINKINVADSKNVPVVIPLLGNVNVRVVSLQVLYTTPGAGMQAALTYAYWRKVGKKWYAVWLPETYALYKGGKCDTSIGTRGLY